MTFSKNCQNYGELPPVCEIYRDLMSIESTWTDKWIGQNYYRNENKTIVLIFLSFIVRKQMNQFARLQLYLFSRFVIWK